MVSVNQKLAGQGYVNNADPPAGPVPTPYVQASFDFVDKSLAAIVAQFEQSKILGNTVSIHKIDTRKIDVGLDVPVNVGWCYSDQLKLSRILRSTVSAAHD